MPRMARRWSKDEYQALYQIANHHEAIMNAMKRARETDDVNELVEQIVATQRTAEEAHSLLSALILGFVKDD